MAMRMPHFRFTVAEYEQMVAVGILAEDDRVEFDPGEDHRDESNGPRHADCVAMLNRLLMRAVSDDVLVDRTEPDPPAR